MHPMRMKRFLMGLSLDELKIRTGIDQGKLSRIERGYTTPNKKEMEHIANAFNCKIKDVFGGINNDES